MFIMRPEVNFFRKADYFWFEFRVILLLDKLPNQD